MHFYPKIKFVIFFNLFSLAFSDYAIWQNGEGPIIFNDSPSIQERTNYPFHNVQFESNFPRSFAEIPSSPQKRVGGAVEEKEETIGDKIDALLPDKEEKEKVLEIVDSRNKSLLEKITEISKVFSHTESHGIDQAELYHGIVETDRKKQGTLHQLRKSISPEFMDIADKFVKVERNFSLNDFQKQAGHEGILGSLAANAKTAFKDFETFLRSSSRSRRQLQPGGQDWNLYNQAGTDAGYIPLLPTSPPATNGNYADLLTKNRFIMPSPAEKQPSWPPAGFFPQEPTRSPFIYASGEPGPIPGFTPPPPLTTTAPAPFGQDLSETYIDKAFEDRNRIFRRQQPQQPPPPRWDLGNPQPRWDLDDDQRRRQMQIIEKSQQTIIHTKTPITPEFSRTDLTIQQKVEQAKVPGNLVIPRYTEQTISQASIPAIVSPPRSQVITKSHIESYRPAVPFTGESYGPGSIPGMDVKVSSGAMSMTPIGGGGGGGASLSSGSIGRYETNIGRYETGEGRRNIRFEIPQTFLQNIQPQIPGGIIETHRQSEMPFRQNSVPFRQSPYGSNTGLPPGYISSNEPIEQYGILSRPPSPQPYLPPIGYQQKPSPVDAVNTRILTNDQFAPNIIPDPNSVVLVESPTSPPTPTTTTEPPPEYTAYPDFREDLFPVILNQAKADNRPASGTNRRQDMFGGGTNEYRQDNGRVSEKIDREINNQKQWPSAVDDRRRKGYIDPEVRYGPPSQPFSIENDPKPPYGETILAERPSGYMEGDDLSRTDMIGGIPYGRTLDKFTTPIPWSLQTTTIISRQLPSIDIDPKLNFPGNRAARPTKEEIIQNRLTEDARKFPERGQIRPYFGPEEITRSRYINANPPENNQRDGIRHRFVKIDLPNTSTLS